MRILGEISSILKRDNCTVPPRVADVGAGLGTMTFNLVATCIQVVAIERHRDAATCLQKRVTEGFKKLGLPISLSEVLTILITDVCGKHCGTLRNSFDVIWCGNVIHQQRPEQVPVFLKRLFDMLKPGGKLFITAHVPGGGGSTECHRDYAVNAPHQSNVRRLFHQQSSEVGGKYSRFPGFMCLRSTQTKLVLPQQTHSRI
jgi:SAM-dependent methyltransferase